MNANGQVHEWANKRMAWNACQLVRVNIGKGGSEGERHVRLLMTDGSIVVNMGSVSGWPNCRIILSIRAVWEIETKKLAQSQEIAMPQDQIWSTETQAPPWMNKRCQAYWKWWGSCQCGLQKELCPTGWPCNKCRDQHVNIEITKTT